MSFIYLPPPVKPEVILPTGDALPTDVRQGKGFSSGDGIGKTGTLPVQVGGTVTPGPSAITKSAGIYDSPIIVGAVSVPADKVLTGTTIAGTPGAMPNRGAGGTVTPGTTNQSKAAGYYSTAITILGDPDLIAANVRKGIDIFGIIGSLEEGKRYATGTLSSLSTNMAREFDCGFIPSIVTITGKDFLYNGRTSAVVCKTAGGAIAGGVVGNSSQGSLGLSSINSKMTATNYGQITVQDIVWEAWEL